MAKNKPLIPVTKNVAEPANQAGQTVANWIAEGHARIRQENAHNVFLDSLIDQLFNEIVKRDQMIAELKASRATNE